MTVYSKIGLDNSHTENSKLKASILKVSIQFFKGEKKKKKKKEERNHKDLHFTIWI